MSRKTAILLLLNATLMLAIADRYATLRDAWRSHNMARAAWVALETDQLDKGALIFGPAFRQPPPAPTSSPGPSGSP